MNWQRLVGASALALCASGCATGMRRDFTSVGPKNPARAGYTAPRQVQESVKADQPDPFLAAAGRPDKSRLTRYFPGLSRPAPGKPTMIEPEKPPVTEVALVASKEPEPAPTLRESAPLARFGWFGHRKPRGPQTYLTDARSAASPRGTAVPEVLPVALQLPRPATDKAVTTTSREVPADEERPQAPIDPDSSSAEARRPPATEPLLAVTPIDPPAAATHPEPEARPEAPAQPEPEKPAAEAKAKAETDPQPEPAPEPKAEPVPEAKPAAEPTEPVAPEATTEKESRGRRRLPSTPATSYVEDKGSPQPAESTATAAAREPDSAPPAVDATKPAATSADSRAVKAVPGTAGDPGNSLGLPKVLLPASYTQHQSVAVRGSFQANQPPPVLASPQVEATPQSPVATAVEAKTWRRPCLRRLIRRTWKLGEFANPPTAAPH